MKMKKFLVVVTAQYEIEATSLKEAKLEAKMIYPEMVKGIEDLEFEVIEEK